MFYFFKSRNRQETFQFGILEDVVSPVTNNICFISNVGDDQLKVTEGIYLSTTYLVDNTIPNQKFIIPTANVDTTSIKITVKESANSTSRETYVLAENILDVTADDKVFFCPRDR